MNSEAAASTGSSVQQATVLTVTLSPAFKLVFVSVLVLTVLGLFLACCIVGLTLRTGSHLTHQVSVLFDLGTSTFKLGFGAIIGLLGGKAL
jgi:hypothetical protein